MIWSLPMAIGAAMLPSAWKQQGARGRHHPEQDVDFPVFLQQCIAADQAAELVAVGLGRCAGHCHQPVLGMVRAAPCQQVGQQILARGAVGADESQQGRVAVAEQRR
ncbi:hypothetical protein [Massilia antarctica]|uniref:hypothetical protein n=1 Tax=Massilia antarctica TaxID=2765360 RepID=UPI0011AECFF5|nr:hypothetical protein [Massilia sp. H27-R4]MCY0915499.1 hypothetical protein [Massilia sp. H27-R4]